MFSWLCSFAVCCCQYMWLERSMNKCVIKRCTNSAKSAARRQKSRRRADYLTRLFETAALIFRAAVSISFFCNFFGFHRLKIASAATLALLAVSAYPGNPTKKRRQRRFLRSLRFSGFLYSLCGGFHDRQFILVHCV